MHIVQYNFACSDLSVFWRLLYVETIVDAGKRKKTAMVMPTD